MVVADQLIAGALREVLKVYAWKERTSEAGYWKLRRYGDMLPRKCFKFRGSEMPFPAFSARHFQ